MLRATLYQQSLLEVDPDEIDLSPTCFQRRLRELVPTLFSVDDFRALHPSNDGAPTACPLVLVAMLLLQFRYNVSDRVLVEQCTRDLSWRYAIGLTKGASPPKTATVVRFRSALRRHLGDAFILDRVLAHIRERGLIDDVDLQAMDSTNTDCRGAVIDTYNLVSTAIGQVVRRVATALGRDAQALAAEWKVERYLRRSVKGAVSIDWSDEKQRNQLITEEVNDAERVRKAVEAMKVRLPPDVDEAVALLAKVALQDVEKTEDGGWKISIGTAAGRVVSITDPEARHGRKSASKMIHGFKTHMIGTIVSQFVTGIAVTGANLPDAKPSGALLAQTERRALKPKETTADAAYATGENLRACAAQGVQILARMPGVSVKTAIPKRAFTVNLEANTVTCPQGAVARDPRMVRESVGRDVYVARFTFDRSTCQACPMREQCNGETRKGRGRAMVLSAHEPELQRLKAFNESPRAKAVLRSRSAVERLISHLVRMGMRHARFFGMYNVQFQAFMVAATYNLQRMFTLRVVEG